ncbi:MAG: hypothetical protein IJ091_01060, partial [Oscillospiraceae bacterium]|nr:hypothetical protein [Oscillospiraceae bacterium]
MSNDSLQRLYRFVSWSILFALLVPVFCLVIPDLFRFGKIDLPFLEYVWNHFGTYRYAFPVLFLLYLFLLLLTRKLWVPTLLLTLISTAMGIVNYDLLHTRGTPLVPSDFRRIFHAIGAWRKGYILTKPEGLLAVWIIIFVLWF